MNKIILMIGTIIIGYFILLAVFPDYNEKKFKNILNRESYLVKINIISFLVSLAINFLIWGWFI
ncbi:MAG: hypothetical protein ACTSW3_04550 [Promethearchaeota archaeon]